MAHEIHKTVCPHDCPDTCSILARGEDGRVTACEGDPDHPFTRGGLCHKVNRYAERVYSPLRVLHPMRRVGRKGEGKFARISWDEALQEVAERLEAIVKAFGGEAILPFSYGGTLGLVQRKAGHPFFHRLGATRLLRNICDTAAEEAWRATYGVCLGTDMEGIEASDLVVLWGINAVHTNVHGMRFVMRARQNGARLVVIDPYRNRTAKLADTHLMPRPGTDAALALGVAHVLIRDGLIDRTYIEQRTFGFDAYRREAEKYPPGRVAEITGIPPAAVEGLAQAYGRARAPFIRVGNGLQRHTNGGQAIRAIVCLPGLTGAFQRPGGGALWETFDAFHTNFAAIEAEELQPHPTREVNMVQLGDALLHLDRPPIKALFVYQANPAANMPDQGRVRAGLLREDLFTVVHEQVHTDTADFADILLPATTSFEHLDLYRSYGHYHLQLGRPVISPLGEARSNLELFQALAERLGFAEPIFRKTTEELIRELLAADHPDVAGITPERLASGEPIRVNIPSTGDPFAGVFPTPSGRLEFLSQSLAARGLPAVPTYVPAVEGHEHRTAEFPLQLMTPPSKDFLNTSFGCVERMVRSEGKPRLKIHPADARSRGIVQDALVRVHNGRGECFLYAEVTEDVPPGVLVAEAIWWAKHHPGGRGINQLTSQRLTDLGACSTLHENLVNAAVADAGRILPAHQG
ncbi:MAG TPA: molybdopterin oxidoreductase family protein [Candidatus Acidoferrum sp.]|nr:molybdopterin oxidoreductase family protein [Candidatus Acidoferrum sp.]